MAGAGIGSLVGVGFAGTGRVAVILGAGGTVAALGGAVAAGWASAWPIVVTRRRSWAGTVVLAATAALGWLASGMVFIPLLAAALVGSLALVISAVFRPPEVYGGGARVADGV